MTKYQSDKLYDAIKYNDTFFNIAETAIGRNLRMYPAKSMTICAYHFAAFLREWADAVEECSGRKEVTL